jgi:N utilization substance protein A
VQSIIKELRGEKIDIIEWSDEPSVFAANALSPAKVSQVRITDINDREMEVIVGEDQLSLAIGKKGQNVRLATRLVGWDINIVSEEVLKREITKQMGRMMASGEAVPLTALQGVSAPQADALETKGITDVEHLAAASVDDLVDFLDISLDEAERIISAAKAIVEAKESEVSSADGETGEEAKAAEPSAETNEQPEGLEAAGNEPAAAGDDSAGATAEAESPAVVSPEGDGAAASTGTDENVEELPMEENR